ncbi:hypothetical protein OESDEN_19389 [Oesophagostomum dentatum]|uniref:Uncharacterized protein n=1 Tax=Oesophagostomum dentatum TaxID=61180 RepID=A0A0B1SCG6_OESDE|nr:hypothetical protein OESDEN_19389 [Oesophagostomum dentatum]
MMSAMTERRNRQIQMTNQRALAMRNRHRGRLNQDVPNEDPWDFNFERERRQRRRDDLRNSLFDVEDQRLPRRHFMLRPQREAPPSPSLAHSRHTRVRSYRGYSYCTAVN